MQQQVLHINITINNSSLKVSLSKIRTVLHLSLLLNKSKKASVFIEIPRFCFHPRLPIAGNCRMCLIELFKAPKLVVACTTRVQDGMVIFTNSILVKKAREYLLEFFLANHPLDCPICDQGGECDLQNQLEVFGLDHTRYTENIKKVAKVINIGAVSFQMTRCIQCTRCVRFLTTVADNFGLGIIARGGKMKISKYINTYLYNEFLSNIVDLCPVGSLYLKKRFYLANLFLLQKRTPKKNFYFCGALTITNSAYRTRSWELYSKYTIDILDNIGADIRIDLKGTDIIRVLPRLNQAVNDYWITEITRYSINGLKVQRLLVPFYKNKLNKYVSTNWATLLDIYVKYTFICQFILKKYINLVGVAGNLVDSKTALSLKRFLQHEGSSVVESRAYQNQEQILDFCEMFSLNSTEFKESSVIFLIGINLRLEAPFYNLKIKKNKNLILVTCGVGDAYYLHKNVNNKVQTLNLGSNIKSVIKVLEGRSIITNYLTQVFKKTAGHILFLVGASVSQRKDVLSVINMLNYFKLYINLNKKIFINVLQPHIGRITANSLNLKPSRSTLKNNNSLYFKNNNVLFKKNILIFYNQSLDDFRNLNNLKNCYNIFNVYMGHTILPTMAMKADLLLPTCTFLEKETLYFNIEGVLRESKIVLSPYLNLNVLFDWQIYFLLFKKKYIFANQSQNSLKKIKYLFKYNKIVKIFENTVKTKEQVAADIFFFNWCGYLSFFFNKKQNQKKMSTTSANSLPFFKNFKKLILTLYFQKFIYLSIFTKTFFHTTNIDKLILNQLLTYSRLFCIKLQYSNKNLCSPSLPQIFVTIKLYLINFPIIPKYRSYFADNIISKNTLDILKIKNNLNLLASNYIF